MENGTETTSRQAEKAGSTQSALTEGVPCLYALFSDRRYCRDTPSVACGDSSPKGGRHNTQNPKRNTHLPIRRRYGFLRGASCTGTDCSPASIPHSEFRIPN